MRSFLALSALVASVAAQAQNLTAALTGTPELANLTTIVSAYPELVAALGSATNITILAPSNDAFAKFLRSDPNVNQTLANGALVQAILSYHILNGTVNSSAITSTPTFVPTQLTSELLANVTGGQRVEALKSGDTVTILSGLLTESNVTKADIAYNNGVIHIIDTVLTAPKSISDTATYFNLTAVAGALDQADLVETVDTTRDLTVFVPNNDAFAAIASGLSNISVEALTSILAYHVVNGSVVYSTGVTNTSVPSFGGQNLTFTVANGSVFVNQAKVVIPNVLVANGVVHVIDGVLNPNNTSAAPGSGPAFAGASSGPIDGLTSGVPGPTSTASIPAGATGGASSSSSAGAARAMCTGFVGAGVMFAGAIMAL